MDLAKLLHELEREPADNNDWGAKALYLCESLWAALSDTEHNSSVRGVSIESFVRFLDRADVFALAREVIIELRDPCGPSTGNTYKDRLILALRARILATAAVESVSQTSVDVRAYTREKQRFSVAEHHRVKLYLQHSQLFTASEVEQVDQWLACAPKALTQHQEHGVEDVEARRS